MLAAMAPTMRVPRPEPFGKIPSPTTHAVILDVQLSGFLSQKLQPDRELPLHAWGRRI